jgi:hypothetical protein
MKDLRTFKNVWKVLSNPRMFDRYPNAISTMLADLMFIGPDPKPKLSSTALRHVRRHFLNLSTLKDALGLLTI